MKKETRQKILWVLLFAAAMAYVESAVVVYLRQNYYPSGFNFPLTDIPTSTLLIELGREAATVIMLLTIGFFCGQSKLTRFAYFALAFGLWDIFYYVWLKLFIGWPSSLLTWDILFLIPLPWVAPVWAPVLVSLALLWAAIWIIFRQDRDLVPRFHLGAWIGEIIAGVIIILTFIWDARNVISGGYPGPFHWEIFLLGLLGGIALFLQQMLPRHSQTAA